MSWGGVLSTTLGGKGWRVGVTGAAVTGGKVAGWLADLVVAGVGEAAGGTIAGMEQARAATSSRVIGKSRTERRCLLITIFSLIYRAGQRAFEPFLVGLALLESFSLWEPSLIEPVHFRRYFWFNSDYRRL